MKSITVRVPATSANLGPGFDSLGIAIKLYNAVTLTQQDVPWPDPFIHDAAHCFFNRTKIQPDSYAVKIEGSVPRSRGLGSSVTVRLGVIAALNALHHSPLTKEQVLDLVIELEGHPDNAVPACFGGFTVSGKRSYQIIDVDPMLKFVAIIPDFEIETDAARASLPKTFPLEHVVENIQNSGLIVSAFASKKYHQLKGAFHDNLHQPYRAKLIPGSLEAIHSAEQSGALGAFISGSGSALMALTLDRPEFTAETMKLALLDAGVNKVESLILEADNEGVKVIGPHH